MPPPPVPPPIGLDQKHTTIPPRPSTLTIITLEGSSTDAQPEWGSRGWLRHLRPGEPIGPRHRVFQLPCIRAWRQKDPACATHPQFCTRNPREERGAMPPIETAGLAPKVITKPARVVGSLTSLAGRRCPR